MLPRFVCASLEDQVHRRRTFSGQFSDPADFRFVESIDGRSWNTEHAESFMSQEMIERWAKARLENRRYFNSGLVACTLTHRDGLYTAAEQDDCILCEDDVLVSPQFVAFWKEEANRSIFRSVGSNGPILLHYSSSSGIVADSRPVARAGEYGIYRYKGSFVASGACYYLHPSLAKCFRAIQSPLRAPCDDWMLFKSLLGFADVYLVHPSPCRIAGHSSNIGYGGGALSGLDNSVMRLVRTLNRSLRIRRGAYSDRIVKFE